MKQGTEFNLTLNFEGLDVGHLEKLEVMFKKEKNKKAPIYKSSVYPNGDIIKGNDDTQFLVPFSKEETYKIGNLRTFYMDTRITYSHTKDQPETQIIPLVMTPTLFNEGE